MVSIETEFYTNDLVESNPTKIYVFGDNTLRVGNGGQAIIRSCSNSFGIVTKRLPSQMEDSYFYDHETDALNLIISDLERLKKLEDSGLEIVFPKAGIGTGLSDMPNKCPMLFSQMNALLKLLFGFDNETGTLIEKGE